MTDDFKINPIHLEFLQYTIPKQGRKPRTQDNIFKNVNTPTSEVDEVVINETGGMQSKVKGDYFLIEYHTLYEAISTERGRRLLRLIEEFHKQGIDHVVLRLSEVLNVRITTVLDLIGKAMNYGRVVSNNGKGYPVGNWKKIPREDHINHALIHLFKLEEGDTKEDHLSHLCARLMMADNTEYTKGLYNV